MTIRIRLTRLPHGEGLPLPSYATHGAAGMDVVAAEDLDLMPDLEEQLAAASQIRGAILAICAERATTILAGMTERWPGHSRHCVKARRILATSTSWPWSPSSAPPPGCSSPSNTRWKSRASAT